MYFFLDISFVVGDGASYFLFGGWIKLNFNATITPIYNNTPIGSTFLNPFIVKNQRGDLYVPLTNGSTVTSLSNTSIRIDMSNADYSSLSAVILSSTFLYSPLVIIYANNTSSIHPTTYCMYVCILFSISCLLLLICN